MFDEQSSYVHATRKGNADKRYRHNPIVVTKDADPVGRSIAMLGLIPVVFLLLASRLQGSGTTPVAAPAKVSSVAEAHEPAPTPPAPTTYVIGGLDDEAPSNRWAALKERPVSGNAARILAKLTPGTEVRVGDAADPAAEWIPVRVTSGAAAGSGGFVKAKWLRKR